MANCSAINSNDIFLMRAGIPSSWEMWWFFQSPNSLFGGYKAVEEMEERRMEIASLGIMGNYFEKYF